MAYSRRQLGQYILYASLALTTPALASDLDEVVMGPEGPFKECRQTDESGKCVKTVELTVRSMLIAAAGMADRDSPITEQVKHGKLASDLITMDKLSLSAEDIAFLKKQLGKIGYSTIAIYRAVKLLDPASVDK